MDSRTERGIVSSLTSRVAATLRRDTGFGLAAFPLAVLQAVVWAVPKRNRLALISSFPSFDDSLREVVPELRRRGFDVVVLDGGTNSPPSWLSSEVRVIDKRSISGIVALARARTVLFTHGLFTNPGPRTRQLAVNLWHGMPIKRIGYDDDSFVPRADICPVTSDHFVGVMSQAFGYRPGVARVTGLPRNDRLLAADVRSPFDEGPSRFLVFLPTYRRSASGQIRVDTEIDGSLGAEIPRLESALAGSDLRLVVKPHPLAAPEDYEAWRGHDHIDLIDDDWLLRSGITLYELLAGAAGLISDFSSVSIDFHITGRPQVSYVPDWDSYVDNRGLYFSREELALLGPVLTEPEQLTAWVSDFDESASTNGPNEIFHASTSRATPVLVDEIRKELSAKSWE